MTSGPPCTDPRVDGSTMPGVEMRKIAFVLADDFEDSEFSTPTAALIDQEVVVDGQFISSRNRDDLPAFTAAILERLGS